MQGLNPAKIMEGFARTAIANQLRKPGDYVGEDGLLVCGTCHVHRQKIMDVADPTPEDPNHTRKITVTVLCKCEQEEMRKEEEAKKAAEDMEKIRKLRSASLMDA